MPSYGDNLVERAAAGDKRAFTQLVEPEIHRLVALAGRMLGGIERGEDAVQDALASVWIARHRLDPGREIGPYLTTSVLNKCRDRLRKRKISRVLSFGLVDNEFSIPDDAPGPAEIAEERELLIRLQSELDLLPIRLREALVLVSIDGRSQAEAAALLGVTEKAIETRVYRARQRLRARLQID
jgi:RNA polymerase sigma factor CnrH